MVVLLIVFVDYSCKQNNPEPELINNTHRIKNIIGFDAFGTEISREAFIYENEKLVLWQCFRNIENLEMKQTQQITFTYNEETAVANFCLFINKAWNLQRRCIYQLRDMRILEKTVSRHADPPCFECWKYNYKYLNGNLIEWKKYIKTESDEWQLIRKNVSIYKNNLINECQNFVNFDYTKLKPDYKKIFLYENDLLSGWIGGTCKENEVWQASQKIEYLYEQNNISSKIYYVRDFSNELWTYFGTTYYYYNENNYLIEESTSSGSRKIYEYEKGHGNASLFYNDPETSDPGTPVFKSAAINNS